jgi:phosphatidylinositol alpha-1,6-mannosyltransferase
MHIAVSYDFLPKIGGAHSWLYEVYRRWPSEVRVLTARPSEQHEEAERQRAFDQQPHGSIRIFREAVQRDINLADPGALFAFFRQARCIARLRKGPTTCLHVLRAFPEGLAAWIYCTFLDRRARLITYAHGEEILIAKTSAQLTLIARLVYARSDIVIVNSESTRRMVLSVCPRAKIVCINPGVDVQAYRRTVEQIETYRSRWGWPADTVVVATVARMEARKNHGAVIEAVAKLRAEGLPLAYVCGGDGDVRAGLIELAQRLGVQQWVKFPGAISEEDKRMTFAACDIHAMPSIQIGEMIEGYGIVFLEAAAAGVPSLCGDSGGQPEAVVHGKTGLVVDGTRLESVIDAMRSLAADATLRKRMGMAAREWVAERDWERVQQRTLREVEKIAPESLGSRV